MYGAILGDIIGSPYEFDQNNIKTKEFPLFINESKFTDDTVMTIAIFDAIVQSGLLLQPITEEHLKDTLIDSVKAWGRRYPDAGYGSRFRKFVFLEDRNPYNSYGNGAAMRVSSVGWLFDDLATTRYIARITASITHNHEEGLKGAEAVASAIFLARNEYSKEEIKTFLSDHFNYDLERTLDEIRPTYHHNESCQETVPEAVIAFLEGNDFEDVIRNAVSLGGDCDTLTCIAGSIAEAYYEISDDLILECEKRLPTSMINVIRIFQNYQKERKTL